ncbi:MAG: phosphate uptake regulator PhoU [Methanomicrobiaceae archaeon]|nr:phosphate uptake regulator PhoU [Methanomicrobiaceae archaeon]
MEIRKVQISGGSSYIVSLPKNWIKQTKIQKNDPVGLIVQRDGTLLVTPNIKGEKIQKVKEFEVSTSTDQTYLLRCIIGAYIAGYDTIRIWAHARLPPFVLGLVRDFTSNAVGQEVVEETETAIVIKDLLNPSEMPFDNTLKRMSVIVKGMHEDAVTALKTGDRALAEDVISRDTDIDRLHWLIARQNNLIVSDLNLSRRMNISIGTAEEYFMISRIIERIADHSTRIAYNVIELIGKTENSKISGDIEKASAYALNIFHSSMHAFNTNDLVKANDTILMVKKLEEMCKTISTHALKYESQVAIFIVHISDSIHRIGDYSADICEVIINHLIGEEEQYD